MGKHLGVAVEDVDTPELKALAAAARRRQRRWLATILGGTTIAAVLAGFVISTVDHPHAARHHPPAAMIVLTLVALLLVLAAEAVLCYWLVKTGRGLFKAPLALGLPYRDRRVVLKSVRRGTPPPEPTLRAVGLRMAERTIRYRKQTIALYGVFAASQAVNALIPDRPGWLRGLSVWALGMFLCALAYQRVLTAGARRYLEQCRQPRPEDV
ncbi:MAG TPA: hypothetical protein VFU36_02360 [Jatrophihabitans sp.]|nr:hypothetical protein [Jatrophihabitans sp.]